MKKETLKQREIRRHHRIRLLITAAEIIGIALAVLMVLAVFRSVGLADGQYVMCMDRVNIRMGAGSRTDCVGWLEPGDVVYPDGKKKNGFIHCEIPQIEAGEGWVHRGYLVDEKPERTNRTGVVASTSKVQARKNVGGARRMWLKPGGELTVYWWTGEWCLTNCGYVKSEFIELDGE